MMVRPKTEEEIELLRENAIIVSKTLAEVGRHVAPGVTTAQLNKLADEFIRSHGAVPSFLGYEGFPAALCMSVNDVVVHGFPSDYVLKEGDVVSVDCGTLYKGWQGDSAYTFPVGEVDPETRRLLDVTKASLYKGIEAAVAGNRTGDIGYAVQSYVEAQGFSVVRELEGHGLGREMHEPMINAGVKSVYLDRNGWAVHTSDHKKSAHYELTVVVRKGRAEQLSTFDFIEKDPKINF